MEPVPSGVVWVDSVLYNARQGSTEFSRVRSARVLEFLRYGGFPYECITAAHIDYSIRPLFAPDSRHVSRDLFSTPRRNHQRPAAAATRFHGCPPVAMTLPIGAIGHLEQFAMT
jgi:hypothetical protein